MKLRFLSVVLLSFFAVSGVLPTPSYAAAPQGKIEDPVLDKAIRAQLKLDDSAILDEKYLKELTSLYVHGDAKIKSLAGLNLAYNLEGLYLPNQEIADLSPLSGLYRLKMLAINDNRVANVCALSSLYGLEKLIISNNQIEDLSCLTHLTALTDLLADHNKISNIEPLAKSPLKWLNIAHNPVQDLSPISGIDTLANLYIDRDSLGDASKQLLEQFERSGIAINAAGASSITVKINEDRILFDHAPVIENGTTLVQFRPLFEKLGFTMEWDGATSTIHASKPGVNLSLQVGSAQASLNNKPNTLDVAPKNIEGSVFVPVRFVGEASGYEVTWLAASKTIYLMPEREVVGADGRSKLTIGGKWLSQELPSSTDAEIYVKSGTNGVLTSTNVKWSLDDVKTLDDFDAVIRQSLDPQHIINMEPSKKLTVNGLEARQFTYAYSLTKDLKFTYIQTLIEGQFSYFRVILVSQDAIDATVNDEYAAMLQTFQEIKQPYELSEEKFGAMKPAERYMDAAHYYRNMGFFEKDKALNDIQFDTKFGDAYRSSYASADWNPFDSSEYYDEYADLYVLQKDEDRVWYDNSETDVSKGKDAYKQLLEALSRISRGSFKPADVKETWEKEDGPITISFTLGGQKKELHADYVYGYFDLGIVKELNAMIKPAGYEFAVVSNYDDETFVMVLTAAEKKKLQEERYLDFITYE
ncbi:stalk domain-containing protein [Paenibacillus oryzisoli]|uniref:stalk domain-containing protein n=1 Tax=Paenibacillus oryzisoli TaxID=1850517 RepID=UPI003D276CF4